MPEAPGSAPPPEPPKVPASCSLDAAGLQAQRARYARLAPSVIDVDLSASRLRVTFGAGFDRRALAEVLAVERECCPFYRFELNRLRRQLRVTVDGAEHRPALAALALALGGPQACPVRR